MPKSLLASGGTGDAVRCDPTQLTGETRYGTNFCLIQLIRDQFTLKTWMIMGASAYALVSIFLPKSAHYLAACLFALLAYSVGKTTLQIYGIIPNPAMARVIPGKSTTQIPDINGNMPTEPGKEGVVVLLLGFKSNQLSFMLSQPGRSFD